MATEANKALVRRYVELWNTGNLALADEIPAPDFVDHSHPGRITGPESVQEAITTFRAAFSDAQVQVEQIAKFHEPTHPLIHVPARWSSIILHTILSVEKVFARISNWEKSSQQFD